MRVRPARAEDAARIVEIWNHYVRETAATFTTAEKTEAGIAADIAARVGGGAAFLVAEEAGGVIGFATSFQFRGGPGYRHTMEHSVLLDPRARSRGAGRALMTELARVAREGGAHVLVAGVSGENPAGVAFHEAIGFARVGEMPEVGFKFGRWMSLVLMQKIL
ncbi:MAG: N-acetyltransferase family protein [Roseovarius sp.]